MKTCNKCHKDKPADCFFKDKSRPSGLYPRCKDCERIMKREQRLRNPETFKKKDEKYYRNNKRKFLLQRSKWYKKNNQKVLAHQKVKTALLNGVITRPRFCENYSKSNVCSDKLIAHHDDYLKPLDVSWLCTKCHMILHHGK